MTMGRMHGRGVGAAGCRLRRENVVALLAGLGGYLVVSGCARELTIAQADYINTAMHSGRAPSDRTGEPLEINIVCVHPGDLKHDCNQRLGPEEGITSDVWFEDRPIPGDDLEEAEEGGRFWLPKSQIFLMTYAKEVYGKKIHDPLRGATTDGRKEIKVTFSFAGPLHNDRSVIYVFAKFVDQHGDVLPTPPAKLHPPGAYTHDLSVEVGVDESGAHYGQFIANRTQRKMHGKEE